MYYKLIYGNNIVGVISTDDFRKIQPKNKFVVFANENDAQFVQFNNKYYFDYWLKALPDCISDKCVKVDIIQIDTEEYTTLAEAFQQTGDDFEIEIITDDPIIEINDDSVESNNETVEVIKKMKIEQMKKACTKYIENGFDITLSDGMTHHFSLTENDQLNLITLSIMIESGESLIPYHADGELCVFYSKEDATAILNQAIIHKTYVTTLFNSLKSYINNLTDIKEISKVQWETTIPVEYQSDVYKYLTNGR